MINGYFNKPFGNTLLDLGTRYPEMVVVDADLQRATETDQFQQHFPERYFDVGIAEANMVGIAAGLALSGKTAFCGTFATFISQRVCDQVVLSVAYNRANVKLAGIEPGLASGRNGASHQAMLDLAMMRAIPRMQVFDPADATETISIMNYLMEHPGPAYLRVPRGNTPILINPETYEFEAGKSITMRPGTDLTIIACGITVISALETAEKLAQEGISARVIDMASIKPIDETAIQKAAEETGAIVTVENHNIYGGMGSAVCEVVTMHCPVPVIRVGIKDVFGEVGPLDWLANKFGIDSDAIHQAALSVLETKSSLHKHNN